MNRIAKAVAAGAGTALATYSVATDSGHLSWLTMAGSAFFGVLVGLVTWATPNAPAGPKAPTRVSAIDEVAGGITDPPSAAIRR